jgi:glycerate kinase
MQPPVDPPRVAVEILADVNNPLLGHRGAARVFGPQKGATPAQVRELTLGLHRWARVLHRATCRDLRWRPGGGAAGGLAAALAAAYDAPVVSGAAVVLDATRLAERLSGCTACLTGEGRLDSQTHGGKAVAAVAAAAAASGVPCVAFVGQAPRGAEREVLRNRLQLEEIIEITNQGVLPDAARARTAENLRVCAADWLRRRTVSRAFGSTV